MSTRESDHVAIIPSPGMGHLIPFMELAKLLVSHHHFSVTFIIPSSGTSSLKSHESVLQNLPENLHVVFLPPARSSGFGPTGASTEMIIGLTIAESLPLIRDALVKLTRTYNLVSVVVDPFGLDVGEISKELKVPLYMYFGTAAMNLLFTFYLPRLDQEVKCEFREMTDLVELPGCVPLHGRDFADPFQDRSSETYKQFLEQSKRSSDLVAGILINSYLELEPEAIQVLQGDDLGCPPVYPIGPIIQSIASNKVDDGSEYMRWLDRQPSGSVLFVSFGSGGTLSCAQLHELALGLEMSGQRFLWIVRPPSDASSCPSYCGGPSQDDPFTFLPNGFIDRTMDRGLVVSSWACQIKILNHESTGGFLTHCGWNSVLESITHGVLLIAWPLYAEQKTNAVLLTDGLKVALRPKINENGLVAHDEVSKVVRSLMQGDEGKRIRDRARELKESAHRAISDRGSSTKALDQVATRWRDHH
ncbi:Hydroquinone glucosyltransferase-like protein [Drosera capensis]